MTEKPQPAEKPRLRWYQYRLWHLCVLTTWFAVACSAFAVHPVLGGGLLYGTLLLLVLWATSARLKYKAMFAVRFVVFGCVMAFINLLPYLLTRGARATDGFEVAGCPLCFYSFGGPSLYPSFNLWAMAGDIVIATAISALLAWLFDGGTASAFRKVNRGFQKVATWGTPFAEYPDYAENPDTTPVRFQFSLRTLLLVVTACALLFSSFRIGLLTTLLAVVLAFCSIVTVVIAWARRETHVADAILFTYIVIILSFLAVSSLMQL